MSYESKDNPIVQLYKNPRHRLAPESWNLTAQEVNRSCGDQLSIFLSVDSQSHVQAANFTGEGCSLCLSSAELACRLIQGLSLNDMGDLARGFSLYLRSDEKEPLPPGLPGEFEFYNDLRTYPMRQKCALMAWEVLEKLSVNG